MAISVDAEPLQYATYFLYLGHTVAFNNSNWEALYQNLRKARRCWGVVSNVLTMTREKVWAWAMLYKVVVHTVFPYGAEIWVVTG